MLRISPKHVSLFQNIFCDIDGPVFALLKNLAYILADDTDAEQLDAAKQQRQNDHGGIAGNVDANDQLFQHHNDQIKNCDGGGHTTKVSGDPQGLGGKTDDAFDGIVHQFLETPLCNTVGALTGGVGDKGGVVTHPGENTLAEAVALCQTEDAVPHAAAEGAEIAGIGMELHIRKPVDDGIEAFFEEGEY